MTNAEYYARQKASYVGNPVRDNIQSYSSPTPNIVNMVKQQQTWHVPMSSGSNSNPGSSGGGNGGSGSGNRVLTSSASYTSTPDNSYADQLRAMLEAQEAIQREAAEARRRAAEESYNRNMSALNDAYNQKQAALKSNLDSTNSQLGLNYQNSVDSLNTNAANQLKEAYVNRMMAEKNLGNQLAAYGLTGGATESALASLQNNYSNSRNNINTATQEGLTGLNQDYQGALASALQNYNSALADAADSRTAYQMQLENDLANETVSSYNDLYSNLAKLQSDYQTQVANLLAKANTAYNTRSTGTQQAVADATLGEQKLNIGELTPTSGIINRSNATESVQATAADTGLSTTDAAEAAQILRGIYENGGGLAAITNTLGGRYGLNAAQIYALASQNGINLNTLNY